MLFKRFMDIVPTMVPSMCSNMECFAVQESSLDNTKYTILKLDSPSSLASTQRPHPSSSAMGANSIHQRSGSWE